MNLKKLRRLPPQSRATPPSEPLDPKLRDKGEDLLESVCFKAGTRVRTESGWAAIETLSEGDTVVSCDFWGEQCVYRAITRVMASETSSIVHLTVNGETIEVTPNHPVYVADETRGEFTPVGSLKVGDKILALNGDQLVIDALEREELAEPMTVYNLEVHGVHNYYVSAPHGEAQDLLVHNCNEAKKLGKHAKDFGAGLVAGAAESIAGEQTSIQGNQVFEDGRHTGKIAGAVAQIGLGAFEVVTGGVVAVAACATGVGCIIVPAAIAEATAGVAVVAHGAMALSDTIEQGPTILKREGGVGAGEYSDPGVELSKKSRVRTEPSSLRESLALKEAQNNPGTEIMKGQIKDSKYPQSDWSKMSYKHRNPDGSVIDIHHWQIKNTGIKEGFKFKNNPAPESQNFNGITEKGIK